MSPSTTEAQRPLVASRHARRPSSPSPVHTTSLTHVLIAEAVLKSDDLGATLDFGHKALTDVGEYGAEELATIGRESSTEDDSLVLRINLSSNKLATLPMAFALLSSLRYLNLRNNSFTVFPDVLTVMASLEILEIGRNKIKRLPSQPGSLLNLRIFSIYKNKITRLPPWFTDFTRIEYLRCDQNPLEWPPRSLADVQPDDMVEYILSIQRWIANNGAVPTNHKASEDAFFSPTSATTYDSPTDNIMRPPLRPDEDINSTPHARSFSVSSEASHHQGGSIPLSDRNITVASASATTSRHRPLQLTLPSSVSSSIIPSPNRSPDSYLPTPDDSVSSTDDELYKAIEDRLSPHARNASYSGSQPPPRPSLLNNMAKKSLPNLRPPVKLRITDDFSRIPALAESPTLNEFNAYRTPHSQEGAAAPFPVLSKQDSTDSDAPFGIARPPPRHSSREPSISVSPVRSERSAPAMDVERNSYFRRYSTLHPSSLRKTIPEPLLQLVDAVRGILFAVSQIYQALQHYTVYAIDDRLSSILMKVLNPASAYMMQLINALDRFDSTSKRAMPTPAICRAVIESCRDNVVAFGKAVGVLSLQLKVLATSDDDRYTRQMLLVLYGASAEISNAWQSIVPNLTAVEPLLRDLRPPLNKKPTRSQMSPSPVGTNDMAPPVPQKSNPVALRSESRPPNSPIRHIARRHAGSFSIKDLETGKSLPSVLGTPNLQGGIASAAETPTPRPANRIANGLASSTMASTTSANLNRMPSNDWNTHSRQGSQSSLATSSIDPSSPTSASRIAIVIPETPSSLNMVVDKSAIDAMVQAVEAAPPIWSKIESMLDDVVDGKDAMRELLTKARSATTQLGDNIENLRAGTEVDRKLIREAAHSFVKVVVQVSNELKTYGLSHPLSSVLRGSMVKLTNASEEFIILLHVSSFSSSRLYTPTMSSPGVFPPLPTLSVPTLDDTPRLGASLSRSRSAAAAQPVVRPMPTVPEPPRSALPMQSFKVSTPPRRREFITGDTLLAT